VLGRGSNPNASRLRKRCQAQLTGAGHFQKPPRWQRLVAEKKEHKTVKGPDAKNSLRKTDTNDRNAEDRRVRGHEAVGEGRVHSRGNEERPRTSGKTDEKKKEGVNVRPWRVAHCKPVPAKRETHPLAHS